MKPLLIAVMTLTMIIISCEQPGGDTWSDDILTRDQYTAMINRSLISTGNNYRIKQFLSKIEAEEDVTIGYIGGSITEGYTRDASNSYVVGSYDRIVEEFQTRDGQIDFINAGMGGTPSSVGIVRYQRDLLAKASNFPDLIVVEFAVNDYDDVTNGAAYESLFRTFLEYSEETAVILLFSVFRDHENLQDEYMESLGTYYELPMVSLKNSIVPYLEDGTMTESDYFRDQYHPNSYGFQIMSESVFHCIQTIDNEEADLSMALPANAQIGTQFTGMKQIDRISAAAGLDGVTLNEGSFTDIDNGTRIYGYSWSEKIFPNNFQRKSIVTNDDDTDSNPPANDPFTVTATCKNMILLYKMESSGAFGTVSITVDGDTPIEVTGVESDGWGQPISLVLFDEQTASEHTVEICMAEGNIDKYFTIYSLGYTE